jgi:hypothetical protein
MATRIAQDIGEDKQREIVATTLVAFAFSSILTGMIYQSRYGWIGPLTVRVISFHRPHVFSPRLFPTWFTHRLLPTAHPRGLHRWCRRVPYHNRTQRLNTSAR